jgi:mono/diheme cytochrome c family protein
MSLIESPTVFMRPALMACGLVAALAAGSALAAGTACAQTGQQTTSLNVRQLFATSCGWCHQSGGRAEGRGPKLAGTDKSDEYIINQIKKGKPPGMPAFGGSFNDTQINAILSYIRDLKDEP